MAKTISIKWCTEDVLYRAEVLEIIITEEDAEKILDLIKNNHDSNEGINWHVIDTWIWYFKNFKNKTN